MSRKNIIAIFLSPLNKVEKLLHLISLLPHSLPIRKSSHKFHNDHMIIGGQNYQYCKQTKQTTQDE